MSNSVLNPVACELESKNDMSGIGQLVLNASRLTMLIALPVCIVYLSLGEDFIRVWMGLEYTESSPIVLYISAVSTLLAVPHNTINIILYGISKHKTVAYLRVLEAVCNLILSIILVNYIGIFGVATRSKRKWNSDYSNLNHAIWMLGIFGDMDWVMNEFNVDQSDIFQSRLTTLNNIQPNSVLDAFSTLDFLSDVAVTQDIWSQMAT